MDGALHCIGFHNGATCLIRKQVNRVGRVVPQQMVCPTARLTQGIHVGAAKEISLHIHLLNVEFASLDFVIHPLMARVESACVAAHRYFARFFGQANHFFGILPTVCQWNFNLYMLTRFQTSDRLRCVHLRWRAQNHGIDFGDRQAV